MNAEGRMDGWMGNPTRITTAQKDILFWLDVPLKEASWELVIRVTQKGGMYVAIKPKVEGLRL